MSSATPRENRNEPAPRIAPALQAPDRDRLQLLLADQIERDAFAEARDTLEALLRIEPTNPDLLEVRRFLQDQSAQSAKGESAKGEVRRFEGHRCFVNAVAFSHDGQLAVSGSGGEVNETGFTDGADRSIRLWEVHTGRQLLCCTGHSTLVTSAAFSPTKRLFASASRGGTVCLWDAVSGRVLRRLSRGQQAVLSIAFSPDGRMLLTGGADGVMRHWDVDSGRHLHSYRGHRESITSVSFARDGHRAVSGSLDQTIRTWNLDANVEVHCLTGPSQAVMSVAFAADGRLVAAGCGDQAIWLWQAADGKEVRRLQGHSNVVNSIASSLDGKRLLSGSADKSVRLWDVDSGREVCRQDGHTDSVKSVALSPDGRHALSGSWDRTVRLWELSVVFVSMPFVDALRASGILTAPQLEELARDIEPSCRELRMLVRNLQERGWLTPYQVDCLIQGRGRELLIGPFVILEWLGKGGMAQVYKARHRDMDSPVALKVVRPEMVDDPANLRRSHEEHQTLTRMAHPDIVKSFGASKVEDNHCFALEFVDGSDLEKLVQLGGPLAAEEACEYIRQAAVGLQHAHERGLVHRDIKPANLVVSGGRAVKVLDWGLAHCSKPRGRAGTTPQADDCTTSSGTPDFISPEQATGELTDGRGDIYSLGCSLYFLLTGQVPFPGGSAQQKVVKHLKCEPPVIQQLRPDLPNGLDAVVQRMMAKNPDDRYRTAAAVALALKPYCGSERSSTGYQRPEPTSAPVRYLVKPGTSCHWVKADADPKLPVPATIREISTGGIGLVTSQSVRERAVLRLELKHPSQRFPLSTEAKVVHVDTYEEGRWAVDLHFTAELSDSDLRAFRGEPAGGDCHVDVRHSWDRDMPGASPLAHSQERWTAGIADASHSGVGVIVPHKFITGTILILEKRAVRDRPAFTLLVRVQHVVPGSGNEWLLVCSFASEPSAGAIQALRACSRSVPS